MKECEEEKAGQEATDCLAGVGMDLESGREGGTWMAMNRSGQIGALLNVLRPLRKVIHGKRNRGIAITYGWHGS